MLLTLSTMAVLLAGCGDGGGDDTASAAEDPTVTYAGETRLSFGEEVNRQQTGAEPVEYTIAVTGIEAASIDDLAAEGVEVDDPTQEVSYVRFTVTKTSDGPTTSFTGTGFTGITADGTPSGPLTIIGEYAPCQTTPLDDLPTGTAQEQCAVFLVDEGGELVGVRKTSDGDTVSWVRG